MVVGFGSSSAGDGTERQQQRGVAEEFGGKGSWKVALQRRAMIYSNCVVSQPAQVVKGSIAEKCQAATLGFG